MSDHLPSEWVIQDTMKQLRVPRAEAIRKIQLMNDVIERFRNDDDE